jgi:solute carrier family 41
MSQIDGLIVIIPVILNLKGNLEMNLSARLGTAANMGQLDNRDAQRSIITGNLSLLQVQATVVSFVATCVAVLIGLALPNQPQASSASTDSAQKSTTRSRFSTYARKPIRPHPSPTREAALSGLVE